MEQISAVRQALLDKGRSVRQTAVFLVLNVGVATDQCRGELSRQIRFVNLGELRDLSHTGIYGIAPMDDEIKHRAYAILAKSVNPSEVYPATP